MRKIFKRIQIILLGVTLVFTSVVFSWAQRQDAINQNSPTPPDSQIDSSGPILDILNLDNMTITEALRTIVQKSGLNIQVPEGLTTKVKHHLKNVEAFDALRLILERHQLAYWNEQGVIQVMTQSEYQVKTGHSFLDHRRTVIVNLKNSLAKEVAPHVDKSDSGKVYSDETANSLILIDRPDNLPPMEQSVVKLDVPRQEEVFDVDPGESEALAAKINPILTPQVGKIRLNKRLNKMTVVETEAKIEEIKEILGAARKKDYRLALEARIVQIVLNTEHRQGVDWEAIISDYRGLTIGHNQAGLLSAGAGEFVKLSIGTLTDEDYEILLEALDTVGETNVLPPAKMKVQDKEEIKLLVGAKEMNILMTTTTPSSAPSPNENLNFVEVGMKLFVTPNLTYDEDGTVALRIKPDPTRQDLSVENPQNESAVETKISVKQGSTVVIGGLIKEEKIETISKIPLLGDIPIVGLAFRSQDKHVRRTEWILFISPKIEVIHESGRP